MELDRKHIKIILLLLALLQLNVVPLEIDDVDLRLPVLYCFLCLLSKPFSLRLIPYTTNRLIFLCTPWVDDVLATDHYLTVFFQAGACSKTAACLQQTSPNSGKSVSGSPRA